MIKFFAGDNDYEMKQALQREINVFVKKHGDLALERIDAEEAEPAHILESTQSLSFFSSAKMIVISNLTDKELLNQLIDASVVDTIEVIAIIPKLDKRAQYYKNLQKHPGFTLFEATPPQSLPAWLQRQAKNLGGSISLNDARYLIDRVGASQLLLGNEVQKLVLYNPEITKASIDALTEPLPQTTVFQLLDAGFGGNLKKTMQIYQEQRAQKVEPHAIVGMIAWQLHILAIIKAAGNRSVDEIAKEAKINPFVVRKSSAIAKRMTLTTLKRLLKDAAILDKTLKTTSVDADEAVQTYLLGLTA